jgi:hypothetical protein
LANARWHQVWENWAQVIGWLEREPEALDRRLDWRIKRRFLQSQLERKGINWQDPVARELDIKYHQLDHGAGFYYLLVDAGLVETLLSEEEISRAMLAPPGSTRAYLRGRCAQDYPDQVLSANWDVISLRVGSGDERHTVRLRLPDPTAYTRSQVEPILEANAELERAVAELKGHPSRIREV